MPTPEQPSPGKEQGPSLRQRIQRLLTSVRDLLMPIDYAAEREERFNSRREMAQPQEVQISQILDTNVESLSSSDFWMIKNLVLSLPKNSHLGTNHFLDVYLEELNRIVNKYAPDAISALMNEENSYNPKQARKDIYEAWQAYLKAANVR